MVKTLFFLFCLILGFSAVFAESILDRALKDITWIEHASFRITLAGKVIYIDPWNVKKAYPPADYILITHDHYDHFSIKDIDRLKKNSTVILCPQIVADKLDGYSTIVFRPGDKKIIGKLSFEAVAMYNINKPYHPKAANYTGFIIEGDGIRIYNAGDTDIIPEMKKLRDITVAILPCGGTYTMDAKECVKCAEMIKPLAAIPGHYGTIVGDPKEVVEELSKSKIKFVILKAENKE
jgi:L-ascorbate metabolism protein UlaG (beta-lactamase superfamily)